ncbi:TadE family type IV pilus minor pilin [Rothia sp. CCM 9417]|uniref:TadE family type IV pilus minor pilin n=1 Tax=unclassified Rothia (in: high G+C Gram-positive bacteria) TaxID=2689056 RepID=UPI003AD79952
MSATLDRTEGQRGSTTAEFAVALPAVVFILALVLGAAATGMIQLRLEEGARLGARAAARGEDSQTVIRIVQDVEPEARVTIGQQDGMTRVSVSRPAPGLIGKISGWQLNTDAWALTEPRAQGGETP